MVPRYMARGPRLKKQQMLLYRAAKPGTGAGPVMASLILDAHHCGLWARATSEKPYVNSCSRSFRKVGAKNCTPAIERTSAPPVAQVRQLIRPPASSRRDFSVR